MAVEDESQPAGEGTDVAPETDTSVPNEEGTSEAGPETETSYLDIRRTDADGHSFVSTDRPTFEVSSNIASELLEDIQWTVEPAAKDSGDGDPHRVVGSSVFSFRPNPTNRPVTGSRAPNPPIAYSVRAKVPISGTPGGAEEYYHEVFYLKQDEPDIIRQEYVDHGAVPPARGLLQNVGAGHRFNVGNYSHIVDAGLQPAFQATEAEFQRLSVAAGVVAPPAVGVASAYRNPQRNVAAGSVIGTGSRHVWGAALDVTVAPSAANWDRLRTAARNAGYQAICEDGPVGVACNDPAVDHVHLEW